MAEPTKFELPESEILEVRVNLLPDLPGPPAPPLHPATKEPVGPDDSPLIFPMGLIEQEVWPSRRSRSPTRSATRTGCGVRPCSTARTVLERALDTPAYIYYKKEGVSAGLAQAEHRGRPGLLQQAGGREQARHRDRRARAPRSRSRGFLASSARCSMVGISYDQKLYRRVMMETWGATVHRSPSELTEAGRSQERAHLGLAGDRDFRGGAGRRRQR